MATYKKSLTSLDPDYEEMETFSETKKKEMGSSCKKECVSSKPQTGYKWKWLGVLILWFILFTVLFWLIFYSLKPGFVITNGVVDTAKVFLAAIIAALILVIIVWLIKVAINRRYN